MKKILFLLLCSVSFVCAAQDMITTKNGEDIKAKVLEITINEIKYKKAENADSPIYTILKSDVLLIRYENGSKDIFNDVSQKNTTTTTETIEGEGNMITYKRNKYSLNGERIDKKRMLFLLQDDELAYSYYEKSLGQKVGGNICSIVSIVFSSSALIVLLDDISKINSGRRGEVNDGVAEMLLGTAVVSAIPALILRAASNRNKERAFDTYNYNRNQRKKVSFTPIVGGNSLGVAVRF